MKFIAKLIGLTAIGTFLWTMPARSQSPNLDSIQRFAKQYTVRVLATAADSGSGTIIGRQGNRYTVLTVAHVVIGNLKIDTLEKGSCAFIMTHDNQLHEVKFLERHTLPAKDLAIIEFESSQDYPVATLSNYAYPVRDQRRYGESNLAAQNSSGDSSKSLNINQDNRSKFAVFTLGYPNLRELKNGVSCEKSDANSIGTDASDIQISAGKLVDISGTNVTNPEARYQSYEMVYTNMTYVGMSGGPIIDPNGRVIGVHGRADGKKLNELGKAIQGYIPENGDQIEDRLKFGMSLGIPISTVLKSAVSLRLDKSLLKISDQQPSTPEVNSFGWPGFNKFKDDKSKPFYWLELGNQQWRVNQSEKAQQSFDRALEIDQQQRGTLQHYAYFMKGFAYSQAQQHEKALANCIKSTEMVQGKEFYDAWRCQASEYAYLKQFPEATVALNKAIDLRKKVTSSGAEGKVENPSDYVILAELLSAQGDHSNALEKSTIAMGLRSSQDLGDSATLRNLRATILTKMKRHDEALYECDRAISLDPTYATPWVTKGIILDRQSKKTEAIVAYRKATSVNPEDSNSWDNLGFSLYESGQEKEALAAFEKAVRLDPKNSSAKANLEDLRKSMKP